MLIYRVNGFIYPVDLNIIVDTDAFVQSMFLAFKEYSIKMTYPNIFYD